MTLTPLSDHPKRMHPLRLLLTSPLKNFHNKLVHALPSEVPLYEKDSIKMQFTLYIRVLENALKIFRTDCGVIKYAYAVNETLLPTSFS